jgi:hypothetical protein
MRFLLICAGSVALLGSAALADEVTVTHDHPPGAIIEHRSADDPSMHEKTVTHDSNGCTTKTIKKENGAGDSMSKSKTNC